MADLQSMFPTTARQAIENAREYEGMAACERFDALMGLIALTDEILTSRADWRERLALYDSAEREEMHLLAQVQRTGHV